MAVSAENVVRSIEEVAAPIAKALGVVVVLSHTSALS